MEKFLRPKRFEATPNASGSDKAWVHWKRTVVHAGINKLEILINFVSPTVFEYISECEDFNIAMQTLETSLDR